MIQYAALALKPFLMHGVGVSLLLGYLLVKYLSKSQLDLWSILLPYIVKFFYFLTIAAAIHYLLWPSYLDHIEATTALLGLKFKSGIQVYPNFESYTLHGLLYGPLLSEIQALAQAASYDPIFNSKIPGVLSLILVFAWMLFNVKSAIAWGCLFILLTFWDFTYWTRAEPLFLVIGVVSWALIQKLNYLNVFLLGVLAGAASALKLHGLLYVMPFFCLYHIKFNILSKFTLINLAVLVAGFLFAFAASFYPDEISLSLFLRYINLAAGHGFESELVYRNCVFGLILFAPIFMVNWFPGKEVNLNEITWLGFILCSIEIVAVIGGKIGSGPHHLLPFIVVTACYLEMQVLVKIETRNWLIVSFMLLVIYFMLGPLPKKISREIGLSQKHARFTNAKKEVLNFGRKYNNLLMGVSSEHDDQYSLTYYRVLLETEGGQQIDTSAFMDTSFVGMTDKPLVAFLETCPRPVLMPREGGPFSAINPYNKEHIFSDELRDTFALRYQRIEHGDFFDVYTCIR